MLRPDGAHLFVSGKLAAVGLREGLVEGGHLLGSELDNRLIFASELEKHAGERVLRVRREVAEGRDGLLEQLGHAAILAVSGSPWKAFAR